MKIKFAAVAVALFIASAPLLHSADPKPGVEEALASGQVKAIGSGFFISDDGFFVTNQHVVERASQIQIGVGDEPAPAKIIKTDPVNDIALLKADGKFSALAIASSRTVRLGDSVVTIGFPDIQLQGRAPKLTRGEISSLTGIRDDARYFQISVPVQPGNSGGPLVDEHGNVIGVVSAKLSQRAALIATGTLPENVNYAVKSSFLLSFLESVPDATSKLKQSNAAEVKLADVVEQTKRATGMVLVLFPVAPPSRVQRAPEKANSGEVTLLDGKFKIDIPPDFKREPNDPKEPKTLAKFTREDGAWGSVLRGTHGLTPEQLDGYVKMRVAEYSKGFKWLPKDAHLQWLHKEIVTVNGWKWADWSFVPMMKGKKDYRNSPVYSRNLTTSYKGQLLEVNFTTNLTIDPALKDEIDKIMSSVRLEE